MTEEQDPQMSQQEPQQPPLVVPPGQLPDENPSSETWRAKESSKWPFWLILGALGVGVIIVLIVGVGPTANPPDIPPEKTHLLTTKPPASMPVEPDALFVNGVFDLSASVALCDKAGADVTAPGVNMLPKESQITVVKIETVDSVKWYEVKASALDSKPLAKPLDHGWVSSASLKGQKIFLVRDVP